MESKTGVYRALRPILTVILRALFNPTVIGKDNIPDGGAILAGNHINALDPGLLGSTTKRVIHNFAKKELMSGPGGIFFRNVAPIPIDRSVHNDGARDFAVDLIKEGELVGISPEGTRNKSDKLLLPFKFGAVSMAQKADCPIVPYAVYGNYAFRSKNLTIEIGEPISMAGKTLEEANDILYKTIESMLIAGKRKA